MGYQKSKHVEAAQKYLHQGKISQAISEYLTVLKHEPRDQVTLMTVGDLFVRQGETFQALEYFERLAQIYLAEGFLTKAIAIYKKITKLAPEEMRPVERLADLYVQQGVMSEARPIYLQMTEMHHRANRTAQAVALLRKLLDAEPDNARVQSRLAELLVSTNQPTEAGNVLRTAAQQLLRRGDHAEALRFIDRALKADPKNPAAMALRAQVLVGTGKPNEAVEMLQALPDIDAGGDTSSLLMELYIEAGEVARAAELAEKIHARQPKQYAVVQQVAAALLDRNEADRALELLRLVHGSALDGGEHERLAELLARVTEVMPGSVEPMELLVEVYKHTSDSFRLPDALLRLAEAYEAAGQIEPALQAYAEVLERNPGNDAVRRKREHLQAQSGLSGSAAAAESVVAQPVQETEPPEEPAAPPAPEENLDPETQLFVSQSITDVDLYSSYGLTQKALELLEIILQRVPDHPLALERLLDLSVGLNDNARAVQLASRLEQIYAQCGDRAMADRFADLRRRFERTSSSTAGSASAEAASPEPQPAPAAPPEEEAAVPTVTAELSAPDESPASSEFDIPMVDAQMEAEPAAEETTAPTEPGAAVSDPVVHEVDLSEEWAALSGGLQETPTTAGAEESAPNLPEEEAAAPVDEAAEEPAADRVEDLVAEYELALDGAKPAPAEDDSKENVDKFLRSVSSELDAVLPAPAAQPAAADSAPPATAEPAAKAPGNLGPLGDLFEQFRADMGESGDGEDPETHYNLGIAYREMGLIEEAISEFQKVASAYQQGQPFRYAMQCYTLLALAFAEKGQPLIAANWYERALQIPGLDQETMLALRYDLGVSQEMAGDMEAAHKSFSQVYGMNIDYRDVAERLATLEKTR
jgi:pilus assembly protein FimV